MCAVPGMVGEVLHLNLYYYYYYYYYFDIMCFLGRGFSLFQFGPQVCFAEAL